MVSTHVDRSEQLLSRIVDRINAGHRGTLAALLLVSLVAGGIAAFIHPAASLVPFIVGVALYAGDHGLASASAFVWSYFTYAAGVLPCLL